MLLNLLRGLCPLFLCALTCQDTHAQWQTFSKLDSLSYSENFPVYATFNDLDSSFSKGDLAFTHNQFEIGLQKENWSVSLVSRYDYHLKYSNETADLAYRGENGLPVVAGKNYPIFLDANHLFANGIKLAYAGQANDKLQFGFALTLLNAEQLTDGRLVGAISIDNNDTYSGEVQARYHYSEDKLIHRPVSEPSGYGYALDAWMQWQFAPGLSVELNVEDLANAIYWQDAPVTQARLTSATVDFDADGFINTTPLLSGIEGYTDHKQSLPVRTVAALRYQVTGRIQTMLQVRKLPDIEFVQIGFDYQQNELSQWGLRIDPSTQAITLQLQRPWVSFFVGLDNPNYKQAHYLALGATFSINF